MLIHKFTSMSRSDSIRLESKMLKELYDYIVDAYTDSVGDDIHQVMPSLREKFEEIDAEITAATASHYKRYHIEDLKRIADSPYFRRELIANAAMNICGRKNVTAEELQQVLDIMEIERVGQILFDRKRQRFTEDGLPEIEGGDDGR